MKNYRYQKLHSRSGITRAAYILMILIILMLILISIPAWKYYQNRAAQLGCGSSLNTANHQLSIEYLAGRKITPETAKEIVTVAMDGWDDLCPGGGTPYLVEDESEVGYRVVCGIHDKDTKERTRLNAVNALEQIKEAVHKERNLGISFPESVTVVINGKEFHAAMIDEESGLKRGTNATTGVKDTVIYYSIVGHSEFGKDSGTKTGQVWYFSYADEEHCANWNCTDGWSGDSYLKD